MGNADAWMVIVNPKAGGGRGRREWPAISSLMNGSGLRFISRFTEHKYHATELTVKAVNEGYRNIVAVGGDGTVHEVVNGIFLQKKVPVSEMCLAVIPVGGGSGWLRMPGIPQDYREAVRSLVEKCTVLQDVAKVSYYETKVRHTRYMANVAGLGYDAVLNMEYNNLKDEGRYDSGLHLRTAMRTFARFSPVHLDIKADGCSFYSGPVFSVAIGIGGKMDLTIIKEISKLRVVRNIKLLYEGNLYSVTDMFHSRCRKIEIESTPESRLQIDGEAVGTSPFSFELQPGALRIVVAEDYSGSTSSTIA